MIKIWSSAAAAITAIALNLSPITTEIPTTGSIDTPYDTSLVAYEDGFLKLEQGIATYYTTVNPDGVSVTDFPFLPIGVVECDGDPVILGGDGEMAIYEDRQWTTGVMPEVEAIADMTKFKDIYISITQDYVATSTDFINWKLTPTGFNSPAVGVASSDDYVVAVSENGIMLRSENGTDWTPFYYNGYYGVNFTFTEIFSVESTFYALAIDEDNMPIITSARSGLVWTQRTAEIYNDDGNGIPDVRQFQINDAVWDGSQFLLVGEDGVVLALPSCVKCNSASTIGTENWVKGLCEGGVMALMAEDGKVELISTDAVRQTAISAEETKNQMEQGTPLIDVRTAEEYGESHITGSVNIPLSEIETTVTATYPDKTQTIILYCGTGMRSQKALEALQELGYQDVYNLGSIDNWLYDLTP